MFCTTLLDEQICFEKAQHNVETRYTCAGFSMDRYWLTDGISQRVHSSAKKVNAISRHHSSAINEGHRAANKQS